MTTAQEIAQALKQAKRIVAFTGAGASTASGIPDFRSAGGVFDRVSGRTYSGEEALSVPFFERNPKLFYENYRNTLVHPDAKPNETHRFFAKLEEDGKNVSIVTQNIDHLHEDAGSTKVFPLHGDGATWTVLETGKTIKADEVRYNEGGIAVDANGQQVRPNIVLYGDMLNERIIQGAVNAIDQADILFVIGTSLAVQPAASFVDYFHGDKLILINQTAVPQMSRFDWVITERSEAFLAEVWEAYQET